MSTDGQSELHFVRKTLPEKTVIKHCLQYDSTFFFSSARACPYLRFNQQLIGNNKFLNKSKTIGQKRHCYLLTLEIVLYVCNKNWPEKYLEEARYLSRNKTIAICGMERNCHRQQATKNRMY